MLLLCASNVVVAHVCKYSASVCCVLNWSACGHVCEVIVLVCECVRE